MRHSTEQISRKRTWGFRFSFVDGIVLLAALIGTSWLTNEIGDMGYLPVFVVMHFFLFCNVFRIRRKPELIWAFAFVLLTCLLLAFVRFSSIVLMVYQLPVTVVLIVRGIRLPDYHGVFARQLNSKLDEYLVDGRNP